MIYSGPASPKALIIGDFPNHEEATPGSRKFGELFSNKAGEELRRALDRAGIYSFNCGYTYALTVNPEKGNPANLCGKKAEVGKDYPFKPFAQGKYFRQEIAAAAVKNLNEVLEAHRPQIIIALGNVACWLTLDSAKINSFRGSVFTDTKWNVPVIATYSFGQIQKSWELRPIALMDFAKALRFIKGEYRQIHRRILIEPTFEELTNWIDENIWEKQHEIQYLSTDIETARKQITCIGFAPNEKEACCIPFFDPTAIAQGKNFWPTTEIEYKVWCIVRQVLESPIPKLGQNFLYDLQYLRKYHISPRNCIHDTMIKHHALYPEMRKDLGFQATIYTDEAPWKMLRNRHRDALKLED